MTNIINELNQENGSNYKLSVLEKYKDNELLKRILKMTYDKVQYTYGIGKTTITKLESHQESKEKISISEALDILENEFCTRKVTGHKAIARIDEVLTKLGENAYIIERVLDRDLKIGINTRSINKVWKKLITAPPYMRCAVYSKKTANKVKFPAILQVKADGTFRNIVVQDGEVTFITRSGEINIYPGFRENFMNLANGVYIGELLVEGYSNRAEANGLINSDNPPVDKMYVQLWDYLSLDEFKEGKSKRPYIERYKSLQVFVPELTSKISIIKTEKVDNIQEALKIVSVWMNEGLEGGVLKDLQAPFKNGTSQLQLKLKLCIDCEMRITGFTKGTIGTSREKYFGAIVFENDEGTIKGQCSGFSEKQLKEFHSKRDELIGKVMTVEFNDLTKSKTNDYYALSHPRFIEVRNDKDTTDTLETVVKLKEMAMMLN